MNNRWAKKGVITVHDLPDLVRAPSDDNIKAYADRTFVSENWVRERLFKRKATRFSLSLCGIPLEVDNELWVVIILDSIQQKTIKATSRHWDAYKKIIPICIAQLLSKRGRS